jgi:hypothetical protein
VATIGNTLRILGATLFGIACLIGAALLTHQATSTLEETTLALVGVIGALFLVLAGVYEVLGVTEAAAKQAHDDAERIVFAVNVMEASVNRVRLAVKAEREG